MGCRNHTLCPILSLFATPSYDFFFREVKSYFVVICFLTKKKEAELDKTGYKMLFLQVILNQNSKLSSKLLSAHCVYSHGHSLTYGY